jgi:hypothetical protein
MKCNVCCWLAVMISYIQEHLFQPDSHGPFFVSGAWKRRITIMEYPMQDLDANMTHKNDITQVISTDFHFTVQRAIFFRENNRTCHTDEEIESKLCLQMVWENKQQCGWCNKMEHIYIIMKLFFEFALYTSFAFIKYIIF